MPRKLKLFVEDKTGDGQFVNATIKASKEGLVAVEVPSMGAAFLLRPENRKRVRHPLFPFIKRPFWFVKDGYAWSTEMVKVQTAPPGGRKSNGHGNGGGLDEDSFLALLSGTPSDGIQVEDADSSMLLSLLSDKAVGDYIKSKMFIPIVQAAIVVGCIAAILALVVSWLSFQAASQGAQEIHLLRIAFNTWLATQNTQPVIVP